MSTLQTDHESWRKFTRSRPNRAQLLLLYTVCLDGWLREIMTPSSWRSLANLLQLQQASRFYSNHPRMPACWVPNRTPSTRDGSTAPSRTSLMSAWIISATSLEVQDVPSRATSPISILLLQLALKTRHGPRHV